MNLEQLTSRELEIEQIKLAVKKTEQEMIRIKSELENMRLKNIQRLAEISRQEVLAQIKDKKHQ